MLQISLLWKILHKPKEAFEEMRGYVNARDGIIAWVLFTLIVLGIQTAAQLKFAFPFFPTNTLFNTFSISAFIISFILGFIGFLLVSSIAFALGKKFGGYGTFGETLGMLGHSYILHPVQALIGGFLTVVFALRLNYYFQDSQKIGKVLSKI